jgi:hypothetical protein
MIYIIMTESQKDEKMLRYMAIFKRSKGCLEGEGKLEVLNSLEQKFLSGLVVVDNAEYVSKTDFGFGVSHVC